MAEESTAGTRAPTAVEKMVSEVRRAAAGIKRASRRGAEALLHPYRRRKALESARASRDAGRVVVICLGNICRSPYAEVSLRAMLEARRIPGKVIVSGGLIGPGRKVPDEALSAAGRLAQALERHESRLVSPEMLSPEDLLVVMAPGMASQVKRRLGYAAPTLVLGDLDPDPVNGRTIKDPWGGPPEGFTASFARIDRCLTELLDEWERR